MNEGADKKKGGRPLKDPASGKRPNVTFRCRGDLHLRIQDAAQRNDRSVSEEIERRLEMSFDLPSIVEKSMRRFQESIAGGRYPMHVGHFFGKSYLNAHHAANNVFGKETKWYNNKDKYNFIEEYCLASAKYQIKMHANVHEHVGSTLIQGEGPAMDFRTAEEADPSLFNLTGPLVVEKGKVMRLAPTKKGNK